MTFIEVQTISFKVEISSGQEITGVKTLIFFCVSVICIALVEHGYGGCHYKHLHFKQLHSYTVPRNPAFWQQSTKWNCTWVFLLGKRIRGMWPLHCLSEPFWAAMAICRHSLNQTASPVCCILHLELLWQLVIGSVYMEGSGACSIFYSPALGY